MAVLGPRPWVLGVIVVFATAHSATHALIRPLYQVSDEVVYLTTVQAAALKPTTPPARTRCIAPPDGSITPIAVTTKPGFLTMTALELRGLCGAGAGDFALVGLRLVQALSLGVVAASAWAIAALLTARWADAWLAGLLAAAHPIAATHAGAVTPDAWANAFSAVALLASTRLLVGRSRWWDVPVLLASALAAFAWKDTTGFVLVVATMTLVHRVPRGLARLPLWARSAAATGLAVIPVLAAVSWFQTPYLAIAGYRPRGLQGADLAAAVMDDAMAQAAQLLTSSWTALGNFGASTLSASPSAGAIGALLVLAGVTGAVLRVASRNGVFPSAVAVTWTAGATICVLQPSIRQVLLFTEDIHQGRWLLPLLAPAAAVLACGLNGLVPDRQRAAPLCGLGALAAAWSGIFETTRYFWVAFPSDLRESALFIRGTGGVVLDDAHLLSVVRHGLAAVPPALPLVCLVTLMLLSGLCLWYGTRPALAEATPPCTHLTL